jgi:fructoselysine-6-P-deglycase FrlB-like protein
LREQPAAIRESLASSAPPRRSLADRASEVDGVLAVGSGDSIFLGRAAVPAFERLAGVPAEAVEAYDFVTTRTSVVDRRSLVIAATASGKAQRTVEAVQMGARAGAVSAGVTNTPTAPWRRGRGHPDDRGRYVLHVPDQDDHHGARRPRRAGHE